MRLRTSHVNNRFWFKIVIPIPKWIAWFRWLDSGEISRFIVITWGKNYEL